LSATVSLTSLHRSIDKESIMPTEYQTRYLSIRDMLDRLDAEALAADLGLRSPALLDQFGAAARETGDMHRRLAGVLRAAEPDRYRYPRREVGDRRVVNDVRARVLAAMGEGGWTLCPHLRRTPAQPSVVLLPLRRVCCRRCAATSCKPPPGEADRCDLCGSRGHVTFWPVCLTLGNWAVLGDMCRGCAEQVNPAPV
jgi:hypothetical protein